MVNSINFLMVGVGGQGTILVSDILSERLLELMTHDQLITLPLQIGIEHIATFLLLSYISLHYKAWKKMMSIYEGKQLNGILGMTARNIFLFGLILSLSIIIQKYIENIAILQ